MRIKEKQRKSDSDAGKMNAKSIKFYELFCVLCVCVCVYKALWGYTSILFFWYINFFIFRSLLMSPDPLLFSIFVLSPLIICMVLHYTFFFHVCFRSAQPKGEREYRIQNISAEDGKYCDWIAKVCTIYTNKWNLQQMHCNTLNRFRTMIIYIFHLHIIFVVE